MTTSRWLRALLAGMMIVPIGGACSTKMTSVIEGSRSPRTEPCSFGETRQISNGGFRIEQKCISDDNLTVGDGRDEVTQWEFDLSNPKYIEALEAGCPIDAVWIDLELERTTDGQDSLEVRGKWQLGLEEILSVAPGSVEPVQINVLLRAGRPSPYTREVVRKLILEEPVGQLPMQYQFDGRVSLARLTLVCE